MTGAAGIESAREAFAFGARGAVAAAHFYVADAQAAAVAAGVKKNMHHAVRTRVLPHFRRRVLAPEPRLTQDPRQLARV